MSRLFFQPQEPDYRGLWDWNPAQTFITAKNELEAADLRQAESERLKAKTDLDMRVAETLLPLNVEESRAKIASTYADIGLKGAQAKYYADGKVRATSLAQSRLGVANSIEPMSFYDSVLDDSEQQAIDLDLRGSAPTLNRAPVDTEESLLNGGPLSSFNAEESAGDIFSSLPENSVANGPVDLSTLPDNAKLVSSGSGMNPTSAQVMNNASAAMGSNKAGSTFDLAATANSFYPTLDKQSVSSIKGANESAGVSPVEGLKNRSALAAYEQENVRPALSRIVETFDNRRSQAKAFVDANDKSMNLTAWASAQSLKAGAGQALNKFDNDLSRGGYGITAAQVDRVLQKYPSNYSAVEQIAPYLQGSGDIDEAMDRYEQDRKGRVEGDKQRVARLEKLRDNKISILGQSGEMTDERKRALEETDREINLLRSPEEKYSEFGVVNSEAQSLARGWAKGGSSPTMNYLGEPIDKALDKTTHGQKFEQLVFKGGIPVADAKMTDAGLDGNWDQVAMWFKSKGMEMPPNTPITTGVYINNSLVPVRVSYTKGKNGVKFSAQPLTPIPDQPTDKGKATGDKAAPATKYDYDATREQKDSAFSAAKKQKEELEVEIALLDSKAENVPDFTNRGFWGPFAENVSGTLGVKVSGQATTAADKQKYAQDYIKKSNALKSKLEGIKENFPQLFVK
jgi:hypothetical protein